MRTAAGVLAAVAKGNAVWAAIPDPAVTAAAEIDGAARIAAPVDETKNTASVGAGAAPEIALVAVATDDAGASPSVIAAVQEPSGRRSTHVRTGALATLDAVRIGTTPLPRRLEPP